MIVFVNYYMSKINFNDVLSNESSSKVFYIVIKKVLQKEKTEEGYIQALDDNNDFIFNDIK